MLHACPARGRVSTSIRVSPPVLVRVSRPPLIQSSLEQRNRLDWASCSSRDLERQRHEHELVALFFSARLRQRIHQGVVQQRRPVTVQDSMGLSWQTVLVGHGVVHVTAQHGDIPVADLEYRGTGD